MSLSRDQLALLVQDFSKDDQEVIINTIIEQGGNEALLNLLKSFSEEKQYDFLEYLLDEDSSLEGMLELIPGGGDIELDEPTFEIEYVEDDDEEATQLDLWLENFSDEEGDFIFDQLSGIEELVTDLLTPLDDSTRRGLLSRLLKDDFGPDELLEAVGEFEEEEELIIPEEEIEIETITPPPVKKDVIIRGFPLKRVEEEIEIPTQKPPDDDIIEIRPLLHRRIGVGDVGVAVGEAGGVTVAKRRAFRTEKKTPQEVGDDEDLEVVDEYEESLFEDTRKVLYNAITVKLSEEFEEEGIEYKEEIVPLFTDERQRQILNYFYERQQEAKVSENQRPVPFINLSKQDQAIYLPQKLVKGGEVGKMLTEIEDYKRRGEEIPLQRLDLFLDELQRKEEIHKPPRVKPKTTIRIVGEEVTEEVQDVDFVFGDAIKLKVGAIGAAMPYHTGRTVKDIQRPFVIDFHLAKIRGKRVPPKDPDERFQIGDCVEFPYQTKERISGILFSGPNDKVLIYNPTTQRHAPILPNSVLTVIAEPEEIEIKIKRELLELWDRKKPAKGEVLPKVKEMSDEKVINTYDNTVSGGKKKLGSYVVAERSEILHLKGRVIGKREAGMTLLSAEGVYYSQYDTKGLRKLSPSECPEIPRKQRPKFEMGQELNIGEILTMEVNSRVRDIFKSYLLSGVKNLYKEDELEEIEGEPEEIEKPLIPKIRYNLNVPFDAFVEYEFAQYKNTTLFSTVKRQIIQEYDVQGVRQQLIEGANRIYFPLQRVAELNQLEGDYYAEKEQLKDAAAQVFLTTVGVMYKFVTFDNYVDEEGQVYEGLKNLMTDGKLGTLGQEFLRFSQQYSDPDRIVIEIPDDLPFPQTPDQKTDAYLEDFYERYSPVLSEIDFYATGVVYFQEEEHLKEVQKKLFHRGLISILEKRKKKPEIDQKILSYLQQRRDVQEPNAQGQELKKVLRRVIRANIELAPDNLVQKGWKIQKYTKRLEEQAAQPYIPRESNIDAFGVEILESYLRRSTRTLNNEIILFFKRYAETKTPQRMGDLMYELLFNLMIGNSVQERMGTYQFNDFLVENRDTLTPQYVKVMVSNFINARCLPPLQLEVYTEKYDTFSQEREGDVVEFIKRLLVHHYFFPDNPPPILSEIETLNFVILTQDDEDKLEETKQATTLSELFRVWCKKPETPIFQEEQEEQIEDQVNSLEKKLYDKTKIFNRPPLIKDYLASGLLITMMLNSQDGIGRNAKMFQAKVKSGMYLIENLDSADFSYFLPELMMSEEIQTTELFGEREENLNMVFHRIFDHLSSLVFDYGYRLIYILNPTQRIETYPTSNVPLMLDRYFLSDVRKGCANDASEIELGQLIVCRQKDESGFDEFYCFSRDQIIKMIADNNLINPHTKKPFNRDLINKMRKRYGNIIKKIKDERSKKEKMRRSSIKSKPRKIEN